MVVRSVPPKALSPAICALASLLGGCDYDLQLSNAWNGDYVLGDYTDQLRVSPNAAWAVVGSNKDGIDVANCMYADGSPAKQFSLPIGYKLSRFTMSKSEDVGSDLAWVVAEFESDGYELTGEGAVLIALDKHCTLRDSALINPSLPGSAGKTSGLAMDDQGQLYVVMVERFPTGSFHYLLRYNPATDSWTGDSLIETHPAALNSLRDWRLRYDFYHHRLHYAGHHHRIIDPDTLTKIDELYLEPLSPSYATREDWDVFGGHIVEAVDGPPSLRDGIVVYTPEGSIDYTKKRISDAEGGLDLHPATEEADTAYMPLFRYGWASTYGGDNDGLLDFDLRFWVEP